MKRLPSVATSTARCAVKQARASLIARTAQMPRQLYVIRASSSSNKYCNRTNARGSGRRKRQLCMIHLSAFAAVLCLALWPADACGAR
eukprot:3947108-Pleurochrysis_carterae.AAC.1